MYSKEMQVQICNPDILHDFSPFLRVFRNGSVEKCKPIVKVPPRDDHRSGVRSKDVLISTGPAAVPARMFMPRMPDATKKLPLVLYFHGGGFVSGSAFSRLYHKQVSSISAEANALALSVDYRLAPEHPVAACYDDAWASLRWIGDHANGNGPDPWLNHHADLGRVFLVGDSAGANIAHNTVVRAGQDELPGITVAGLALVQPGFGGAYDKGDMLWSYLCPNTTAVEDPRVRPGRKELALMKHCKKVIIFVGEEDQYRAAGEWYYRELIKIGLWRGGRLEMVESKGVGHGFHLLKPKSEQAVRLMDRLASFVHRIGTV